MWVRQRAEEEFFYWGKGTKISERGKRRAAWSRINTATRSERQNKRCAHRLGTRSEGRKEGDEIGPSDRKSPTAGVTGPRGLVVTSAGRELGLAVGRGLMLRKEVSVQAASVCIWCGTLGSACIWPSGLLESTYLFSQPPLKCLLCDTLCYGL